jgi:hypothetical protein
LLPPPRAAVCADNLDAAVSTLERLLETLLEDELLLLELLDDEVLLLMLLLLEDGTALRDGKGTERDARKAARAGPRAGVSWAFNELVLARM